MAKYLSQKYCLSCVDNFLSKTGMPIAAQYFYDCFREIDEVAADVQPVKRGHWIEIDYGMFYECSECGNVREFERNFCSNCGADMRGDENG